MSRIFDGWLYRMKAKPEGPTIMCKLLLLATAWLLVMVSAHAGTTCPQIDPAQKVYAAPAPDDAVVAFEESSDPDNPVDFVFYDVARSCRRTVVDSYSVEGSAPAVEAVFPYTVKGEPNLYVIVAWEISSRGVGTFGKLYQVYAYGKDGKGGLASSKLIADSDEMTGMEGMADGEPVHFPGKDASGVKKLVQRLGLQ